MEYPTLKRPKRKLCYPTNRENSSKQWSGELLLEDVSRMFDDFGSASHDDIIPPSLLLETEDKQVERQASVVLKERHLTVKLPRCQMVPREVVLHPAARSPSPKLDIDIPFKGHGPVKTSSPIERDIGAEQQDNEKDQIVSPILFMCEDKEQEEAKKEPPPIQEPLCNGHTTEENDDFDLESPPVKIVLIKPKSIHKDKVKVSHKESHPGDEKMPTKSQIPVLVGKQKTQRQENTDLPVPERRQEPEQPAPEKAVESVPREPAAETSKNGKMTAFLQKLRDAGQPKPTVSRKSQSPVKVPVCPPEPEDDFLILEDDAPIRFTILSQNATKRRQRLNKTSSTEKDSSADKGMKDVLVSVETTQKQQESDQANGKLETVNQKMKKKGKKRQKEVTETGSDKDESSTPENFPAGDLVEKDKPNQKTQQRLKKESNKAEDKPEDTASSKTTEEEENSTKPQKSSEVKRSKSSKYEKAKTSKAKSLKQTRKEMQGSEGVKETVKVQRSSEEDADVEDLASLSDKEIGKSEAQTANEKNKQSKQSVSVGSSSDDGQAAGKRKRNPPGQWWLLCPESTEETKVTDNQPILKRSKLSRIELGAEISPPAEDKNDGLLKQTHHNTNKKKNKIKLNKHRTTRGDNPDKMKATVEEQTEDQEDQDSAQSSPLVFSPRDHSSGDQIFRRVYHHSNSSAPASPISPRRPSEQLGTTKHDKRSRKPPGQWWKADNMSEDVESVSSQPQQLNPKEPKPRRERKTLSKQSKSAQLGTPKKGNTEVLSKPPGGAPVVPLKPRRAPETVNHMAIFKDIFTSATKSSAAINKKETGQNNRREVTACPADNSAADCAALSNTNKNIVRIDAGESNNKSPLTTRRHSTSTVFRSGPSSMIELEQYEENDEMVLPSTRVIHSTLSMLDLCAPPLKPLILQAKDKVNMTEWLKSLWPATVNSQGQDEAEISPDDFDWYFYQGRAIGFMQDLQSGSILNGKILLGSYMKKPLWVDHSATTVFNVLTSSVSLTIDCKESCFNPGRSFMVQCGHAYSIQNLTAQPAVLCFTRILAESPN